MDLPKGLKCIIFDMDGTLAEFPIDYDAMRKDLKEKASEFGIKSDFRPLIPGIREAAARSGNPRLLSELFAIVDMYEIESVKLSKLIVPVSELYKKAIDPGIAVVILTRNGRGMVDSFLKKYSLPKPGMICAREDIENQKPHPDAFALIKQRYNIDKSGFVMIGDSTHDEQFAKNVGIKFQNCRDLV